jgi:hypothetical protein
METSMSPTQPHRFITASEIEVEELAWGPHEWLCRPGLTDATQLLLVRVRMQPGRGHAFHRHVGLTTKGSIGARTALSLDEAAARVQEMHDAARRVRKDVLVLCHGGPIAEPADVEHVLARTPGVAGFFGASSSSGWRPRQA